jgi:Flp pilus assembly protein TadD
MPLLAGLGTYKLSLVRSQFSDPNDIFGEAQRAFAQGDAAHAIILLDLLPVGFSMDSNVLHFRALALKKTDQFAEAEAMFEHARKTAPRNPEIANNHANLLLQTGRASEALLLYESAIAIKPDYVDACVNRALALQTLGRLDEALKALDVLIAAGLTNAKVQSARGAILLSLGRHDEAAQEFDVSLATGQYTATSLHGRARIALERGESDAVDRYAHAHAVLPNSDEILLGLAEALEAEGNPQGLVLLADAVAAQPDWIVGLERYARMQAEAGVADFTSHYATALHAATDQRAVRLSLAKLLADAEQPQHALDTLEPLPADQEVDVLRAFYLGEAGKPEKGREVLRKYMHRNDGDMLLIVGRLALATGDLTDAVKLLDRALATMPDNIAIWAHCELAWRAAGDARSQWLSGQAGLVAEKDIGFDATEIAELTNLLRSIHRTHAHPVGQSLRGGTQTRGRLFRRQEPLIRRLRDALTAAVSDYVRNLPPMDPEHPLLKRRNQALTIAGSWSVRLCGDGFHVSHIHSEGLLSSACYLSLPDYLSIGTSQNGWLEIGRSPSALNLDLEPIAVFEPAPGKLVLFPSYIYHGTRPFSNGERLTVAFDVVPS